MTSARLLLNDRMRDVSELDRVEVALALVCARQTSPALLRQAMNEVSPDDAFAVVERFLLIFEAARGEPFFVSRDVALCALPRSAVAELAARARKHNVSIGEMITRLLAE